MIYTDRDGHIKLVVPLLIAMTAWMVLATPTTATALAAPDIEIVTIQSNRATFKIEFSPAPSDINCATLYCVQTRRISDIGVRVTLEVQIPIEPGDVEATFPTIGFPYKGLWKITGTLTDEATNESDKSPELVLRVGQ